LTAYVVSKKTYEAMLEKIEALEDQLWPLKADAAREDGFASTDDVNALLVNQR
jgi:hypothetical protein